MSNEDRLHAYSRRRTGRAPPGQRRYRHTTVVTTRGEQESSGNMGQVSSSRRQSVDDMNYVHSNEAILLPKDRECCFSRWKDRKESIKRTIVVFLIAFGVLKMVCGMIFAAIHVVVTFSSPDAAEDLQNPLPVYLSAVMVAISGLCDIVLSKIRSSYNAYMTLAGMFFSISSCIITLAGLLSTASVSLPKFNSFIQFKFDPALQSCTAYTRWDIMANGTFIGGVSFREVSGCSLIESTLPPLITSLVAFYGISCITSLVVCLLLAITLCLPEKNRKLERLRRASMSSYINYDLNLDHICDSWQPEPRLNPNRSTVTKSNSDGSAYLPGVAIPYYTIPYRIPLVRCKSSRGINGRSSSLEFDPKTSRCHCSAAVGDPVLRRFRPRDNSSTSTSRIEFHRSNHRPVIPIEFRCIGIPSRDVRLPRTKTHSRSRPLQLPEGSRNTDAMGRRFRGAIIESMNANKRCEQHGSTDNDSCPPPYYAELPSYARVPEGGDSIGKSGRSSPDHDETIL